MSHSIRHLRAARVGITLLACLTAAAGTQAQPTGNPKGTTAPPETSAPKAGVAPRPAQPDTSGADGGKLVGNPAQTRARMQSANPQGSGTAGGLPSKRQGAASNNDGAQSDKGSAHARPVPPSR